MAIELAVARDDIPSALRHYDIALRTKKNAPDLLFPVLTSALTNPTIRTELVKTLGGRPKWSNDFISHAARSDADRSEEHTSELQSLMRISYAVFCLNKTNTQLAEQLPHEPDQGHAPIHIKSLRHADRAIRHHST